MVCVALVGAGSAFAQTLAGHSFSLDVRPVSSGGAARSRSDMDIQKGAIHPGYYQPKHENFAATRQRGSGVGLQVEVRNLNRSGGEATVEWFFVGKSVSGDHQFLCGQGSKPVVLSTAGNHIFEIESNALTSTVEKQLTLRSGYEQEQYNRSSASVRKSGSKLAGWIVRLMKGDTILLVKASSPSMEAFGRTPSPATAVAESRARR